MNPIQEWDAMMAADGWVLLSHDHPDYSLQQAFCEVACRSRETDPGKLYKLAIADFTEFADPALRKETFFPPVRIRQAFRKWSELQAAINVEIANDPYMQQLEAEERSGS